MEFHSILYHQSGEAAEQKIREAPPFFRDLNLDQVADAITAEWKEYDLAPFFYGPLNKLEAITYRQDILQDLENAAVLHTINQFAKQMRAMRGHLDQAKKFKHFKYAMERQFLAAAEIYCEAVKCLLRDLGALGVKSAGFRALCEFLTQYVASSPFRNLVDDVTKARSDLSAVRYSLAIKGGSITVRRCDGENDYSAAVEKAFEKFRRDATKSYWLKLPKWEGVNRIDAQVQERVAWLYPDVFGTLDAFYDMHQDYCDETVSRFDREVQFYVAYLTYVGKLRRAGLNFCRPQLSDHSKEILGRDAFDLALAAKLVTENTSVVTNDFFLSGSERIFVVTGPNHGGKTTFARMLGQLHYLARLGCLVPGAEARLFLCDEIFTHFEREQTITDLRGKLQDDLIRIRQILDRATPDSLIVMNEVFSSTTLSDAVQLSQKMMTRVSDLDLLCVWVTFLDEMTSFNEKTVSMVAAIDPLNPAVRTFRLDRRPADGLAYALAIAEKHHVTYSQLRERIKT